MVFSDFLFKQKIKSFKEIGKKMKKGLGKGLAALIGDLDYKADNQDEIIKKDNQTGQVNLPIEFLVPNRDQPRKNFSEASLNELSQSIKQKGILLPILARSLDDKKFQIIAGERRWWAAQQAG